MQVGAFRPDVLVLDIRMPRLDGFEVCRRLKAGRETASVRILAMTAYPEGQVRERIRECGADDFLEKPFAIEKFRSGVTALLGKDARAQWPWLDGPWAAGASRRGGWRRWRSSLTSPRPWARRASWPPC